MKKKLLPKNKRPLKRMTTKTLLKKRKVKLKKAEDKPKKKRYIDGDLEFKSKRLLDWHLALKAHHAEGLIKSFCVPVIGEEKDTGRIKTSKITINEQVFDSLEESKYYMHLLKEQKAGNVKSFEMQPRFEILPAFEKVIHGKKKKFRKSEYVADFAVTYTDGTLEIIDVKGMKTDMFKLKLKMFEHRYQDLSLRCVKQQGGQWVTVQ